ALKNNKALVVYLSMGFGNPYGDDWNADIVFKWVKELDKRGIKILSLSDTIGVSNPTTISYIFKNLIPEFSHLNLGAHLHTQPHNWREKVHAAYESGCRRFDGALKGYGGCPMARDELTGNMPTENMVFYFEEREEDLQLNKDHLLTSMVVAANTFPS
ncbi:MAG: hydroxymethylglutaryl-CoA lyase, partial [Saprospiraceae bacterium]|nr:hydroxymethylglutaryl-CoA lyase [Saprospiraceae bacterium]